MSHRLYLYFVWGSLPNYTYLLSFPYYINISNFASTCLILSIEKYKYYIKCIYICDYMKKTNIKNISWSLLAVAIMVTITIPQVVAEEPEMPIVRLQIDNPLPEGMEVIMLEPISVPTNNPQGGGWKASLFAIYSHRYLTEDMRLKLDGWCVFDIVWFNGYDHVAIVEGYMEFWYTDYGEELYWHTPFTIHTTWGGFAFNMVWNEIRIRFPEHERYEVEKIHIYAERNVDNFDTEYYNEVYYEYVINPEIEQVSSMEPIVKEGVLEL